MAGGSEEGGDEKGGFSVFRDIRRYFCDYCGICRSKKSLIRSHMFAHHEDELQGAQAFGANAEKERSEKVLHTCKECGLNFRKAAYLKQHMQSHSLEVYCFQMVENGVKYLNILREALDPM